MSNWDDDDDDNQQDSDLVKQLRKQLKEFKTKNQELDTELGTLRPQVRKSSVASILSELGSNPKIAALLPSDVEPTKEAVKEWLDTYGELFNLTKVEATEGTATGETAGTQTQVVDQATQDMWGKIQSGEAAAGATTPDIEKQQIALLGQAQELSGGSFDKFVKILRGEIKLPS